MRKLLVVLTVLGASLAWAAPVESGTWGRRAWRPRPRTPARECYCNECRSRKTYESGVYYDSGIAFEYEWATPVTKSRGWGWK